MKSVYPKKVCEVLTPSTSYVNLYGNKTIAEVAKMRSCWVRGSLIQ